ncbi:Bax inhibitor-1 family protein [Vibrio coralliirubri]|uniref:Bax inhibitor-1 family protein n=1 Tax=Vibrio coralliirubri TaxID=1516159 RepID=UPI0022847E6A|nr:Bax inhibitor-1 family protein [Vibrio coralliirubri]
MSNSVYLSRGVFNLLISSLVVAAVVLFFMAASIFEPAQIIAINPTILMIGSLIVAVGGTVMASRCESTVMQVFGFVLVPVALGVASTLWLHSVDGQVLYEAMLMTIAATAVMAILSALFPNFFLKISGILFMTLLVIIVISIVGIFIAGFDFTWINALSLLVFMGLLGVDFVVARNSPPTVGAAISISVSMFIDLINIMMSITSLTDD